MKIKIKIEICIDLALAVCFIDGVADICPSRSPSLAE
jgi:hypothetical protein